MAFLDFLPVIGSLISGKLNNDAAEERQDDAQAFSAAQYASRYQTTMNDMRAAGLNPGLAYGGISGNAPTSSAASSSGTPDLGASYNQGRMASAQVANINADTANKDAHRELMEAQASQARGSAWQSNAEVVRINESVKKIGVEMGLINAQTGEANERALTQENQRGMLNQLALKLNEEQNLMRQQGQTQEKIRMHLIAMVEKLITDTALNELDIKAAEKFDNIAREAGQLKPLVELIRMVLSRHR